MNPEQIKSMLNECYGTSAYYKHIMGMKYTEGVRLMAELCGAFWLIDAISSHQPCCHRDPMLRDMQFWFLRKKKNGWELICERDQDDLAFSQSIEHSDFPLDAIQIWVQGNVILLPSEY